MARIHISLVGNQPAPVYRGIKFTAPDKVVLIYSSESKTVYNRLLSHFNVPMEPQKPLHATNPMKIIERAEALFEQFRDDEVVLNISSGLKSWSYLFARTFERHDNCHIIYIDQNNVLWDYKDNSSRVLETDLNMDEMLGIYGNSIENQYRTLDEYTEEDNKLVEELIGIRDSHPKEFTALLAVLDKDAQKAIKESRGRLNGKNCSVEWDGENVAVTFGRDHYELASPNAKSLVFNSGWYEYMVARLLSQWQHAKGIRINCKFKFNSGTDKNEVDVLVNTGVKLLFVECKTGLSKTTDIDKFASVVKANGGTASKGIFVVYEKVSPIAREKCKDLGLLCFSIKEDCKGRAPEKALSDILTPSISSINK